MAARMAVGLLLKVKTSRAMRLLPSFSSRPQNYSATASVQALVGSSPREPDGIFGCSRQRVMMPQGASSQSSCCCCCYRTGDSRPARQSNLGNSPQFRTFLSGPSSRRVTVEPWQTILLTSSTVWRQQLRGKSSRLLAGERGNLWRSRNLGRESIEVVQELKRVKDSPERLARVMEAKFRRLLKPDMLMVLQELQRQEQWQLAMEVFRAIRAEPWYKPNSTLFSSLIHCLGKCQQLAAADSVFASMEVDAAAAVGGGLPPDAAAYTALIGAYCHSQQHKQALELLEKMVKKGFEPSKGLLTVVIHACNAAGAVDAAKRLREHQEQMEEIDPPSPKRIQKFWDDRLFRKNA